MHRIIRTALASLGAAVVVAGGSLGVAYATTPASAAAQTSTNADSDQVAALNQAADDVLAKIATLEQQLAPTPGPTSSPSPLTKEEISVATQQSVFPTAQPTRARSSSATPSSAPTAGGSSTALRTGENNPTNGSTND
jgi:hypothetical protein